MTKQGILNILKSFEDSLLKLKNIKNTVPLAKFSSNQDLQDIVKWNYYIAAQACLDIGNHIVAEQNLGTPETYEEILEILQSSKKINPALADKLKGLAGFRNRLAHGYSKIDPDVLYGYLDNLIYIETYLQEIKNILKI